MGFSLAPLDYASARQYAQHISETAARDLEAPDHCFDAVVRPRQELVAYCEVFLISPTRPWLT
jgi:hypothetical protein